MLLINRAGAALASPKLDVTGGLAVLAEDLKERFDCAIRIGVAFLALAYLGIFSYHRLPPQLVDEGISRLDPAHFLWTRRYLSLTGGVMPGR
jgi:hypothetical protein